MRNWVVATFVIVLVLVAGGVGLLAMSAHPIPSSKTEFSYSVVGCEKSTERVGNSSSYGEIEVTVQNQSVVIRHDLSYTCCAKMKLDWSRDGNRINVTETNEGDMCRCVCNYDVNATIGPLSPGKYTIVVYGVRYQSIEPDLLTQEEIEVVP